MKLTALFAAVGHGVMAAAEKFENSTGGATVVSDAKKTISDGITAAIGYVRQGATQQATTEASAVLTKLGLPAEASTVLAGYAVSQGEGFLTSFIPAL